MYIFHCYQLKLLEISLQWSFLHTTSLLKSTQQLYVLLSQISGWQSVSTLPQPFLFPNNPQPPRRLFEVHSNLRVSDEPNNAYACPQKLPTLGWHILFTLLGILILLVTQFILQGPAQNQEKKI